MSPKTWLRRLGIGLIVLSFYLLLRELLQFGPEAMQLAAEPALLAFALGGSLFYAALLALPAAAWSCALREGDGAAFVSRTAVLIYARCNILKYLPGNVFHFGGRQVMAHRAGWSHRNTLTATTLEIVSLPLTAGCVALIAFALAGTPAIGGLLAEPLPFDVMLPTAALGLSLAGLAAAGAAAMARHRGVPATSLTVMAAFQIAFFAASAGVVASLALAMGAAEPADLPMIAAAYLASWVVGFVVPGAPGGIGVREAVFLHLAAPTVDAPAALALALLARLVTTLGDLWFSLLASASALPAPAFRNGG
jgi:hypothetical protein